MTAESKSFSAPYAMDVLATRGRRYPEPPHPYRNDYARDRDRVIHSRAFRRLEAKTQVFTTRYSDHFRTRLTHTLEVAQIARTIAAALGLNADLAEALALAHDLGHPPFGHAGERALDALMGAYGDRFDHNLHALRIVEQFEQRYLDFPGLNLTFEVREGIVKHSQDYDAREFPALAEYFLDQRPPLEAQIMDSVDEIAYNTADLDDGREARLLDVTTMCAEVPLFAECYAEIERAHPAGRSQLKFNAALRKLLDILATDLIANTAKQAHEVGVKSVDDVRRFPRRLAGFSLAVAEGNATLKQFLRTRLYDHPSIVEDRDRSVAALKELFAYYIDHPEAMPPYYARQAKPDRAERLVSADAPHRVVCDYVAGMTDQFLLRLHAELIGPSDATRAAPAP
ncbi:MAG: deoxyguanosinetriphosphate triphosphohydrolase [Candidatus Acidiferrales bacterium]